MTGGDFSPKKPLKEKSGVFGMYLIHKHINLGILIFRRQWQ